MRVPDEIRSWAPVVNSTPYDPGERQMHHHFHKQTPEPLDGNPKETNLFVGGFACVMTVLAGVKHHAPHVFQGMTAPDRSSIGICRTSRGEIYVFLFSLSASLRSADGH